MSNIQLSRNLNIQENDKWNLFRIFWFPRSVITAVQLCDPSTAAFLVLKVVWRRVKREFIIAKIFHLWVSAQRCGQILYAYFKSSFKTSHNASVIVSIFHLRWLAMWPKRQQSYFSPLTNSTQGSAFRTQSTCRRALIDANFDSEQ